jgi:pimeloyl-ACP methyl ester carboxylesterase
MTRPTPTPAAPPDCHSPRLSSVELLTLSDGRTLCVRRCGGRGGRTAVLLHGLFDSSEGWSALCRELSGPIVAFDLPGFGHSDMPTRGMIADYARDVAEGLALLGTERFTLVGHSLGGAVGAGVAELMPGSVHALVLLAPVGFGRVHLAEVACLPGVDTLARAILPWALSSRAIVTASYVTMVTNGRLPAPDLVERVTSSGRRGAEGGQVAIQAIAAAGRSRDAFHRRRVSYDGPVTAVWGDHDRLVPLSHQAGVRSAFPQASVHVWHGMGHHPVHERLEDLVAVISQAAAQAPRDTTSAAPLRPDHGRRGSEKTLRAAGSAAGVRQRRAA